MVNKVKKENRNKNNLYNSKEILVNVVKQNKKDWKKNHIVVLLSEFFGTIALTLWIILPSTLAFSEPDAHLKHHDFWVAWGKIWELMFMKAFWAGIFVCFIVYLLRPISANLNPSVTIAEVGADNIKWVGAGEKIVVQLAGGICAGFFAYLIADAAGTWHFVDSSGNVIYDTTLDAISPKWTHYNFDNFSYFDATYVTKDFTDMTNAGKGIFISSSFLIEILLTYCLIGSVFWFPNKISHFWRPVFVGIVIWIVISIGIRTNNIPINPARLMGPAIAHDVMSASTGVNDSTMYTYWMWFYLIAEIIAGFLFYYVNKTKINKKRFTKQIEEKN